MTNYCQTVHGFPCQFPAETDFFDFDGKKWCRFHLPLQDAAGNKSDKGRGENGWEEVQGGQWQAFTQEVIGRFISTSLSQNAEIDFRGIAFPGIKLFSDRQCHVNTRLVNFSNATFGDGIDFYRTVFHGSEVNFKGTIFYGSARFDSAQFSNPVNFSSAAFNGEANFGHIIFPQGAYFTSASFDGEVNFTHSYFKSDSDFKYVKFNSKANFNNAVFLKQAEFEKSVFKKQARFENIIFKEKTDFSEVKFGQAANFSIQSLEPTDLALQEISFSKAIFSGPALFRNRDFTTNANFNGAVFHDLAEFHGCEFHPAMSFHQTEFQKTKGATDAATEELERSYRTLKLGMESLRARNEEADFFALEMECRRQRRSVHWTERLAACLYKHLSDYGRSLDLPLLFFLLLLDVFFLIFGCFALAAKDPESIRLAGFTLEQVFRPFYVWGDVPKGAENGLVAAYPLLIPLLASLQSLITIGLLTLFLLALRRRFKMD